MFTPQIQSLKSLIRQGFSQVSLRTLLTVPFLLQMLGIVGLTGYLSWQNGEKAVNKLVSKLQNEVSDRIEQKLYSFLETPKLVTEINQKAVELGELDIQNRLELQRRLWQQIEIFERINFIQFGTYRGNYIGIYNNPELSLSLDIKDETTNDFLYSYQLDNQGKIDKLLKSSTIPYDPRVRPWYEAAIEANQPIWADLYNWFDEQGLSLTFVRPIRNNQNQIIGVTGADISFQEFNEFLRQQKIGQSGQIFIIDRQGYLIASSTLEAVFTIENNQASKIKAVNSGDSLITASVKHLVEKFEDLNKIKDSQQLQFINEGKEEFIQVVPFKDEFGLDWLIVVVVPEADFMEEIYANTRTTILLCLGALVIAIIIGIFTSRQLTRPIIRLSKAAKGLSGGNWNQTLEKNPVKEFNILAIAFHQMSQELQQSYQQLEEYSQSLEQKVTERTQECQQSEQKFSTAFRNTPNPIIITRMSDRSYFDVNESFCRLTGYTHEEILGKTSLNLNLWVTPEDYEQFYKTFEAEGKIRNYELNYRTKSGEIRTVLLSADLIEINGEQYLLSTSNDITDRKQFEAQLQTQNIELETARKNADAANQAKSIFLANMSHELRTPLNAILGFSQLMSKNPIFASASKELEIINRSGEHLLSLINDILDLSKIEAGKIVLEEKPFDLYFLLDSLEEMLKMRTHSKGIQLTFERSQVPQYIQTDEKKLRQVLINIIGNAIKFTEEGSITLRIDSNADSSKAFTPNTPVQLLFEVEDTGAGISPEEIEQLFDAFVQTSAGQKSQQGTGLGLSISRKFIQLMGGDISVESQLEKGSIFKFNIQATTVKAEQVIHPKPQNQVIALAPNQPQYRILVVDEIVENRLLVSQLLQPLGFAVFEAENGLEAITQWEKYSPHLIWMDIRMPVMDGYQATQHIKATPAGKNTIIIALTASALSLDKEAIFAAGCDDILNKPFQPTELLEKIATHLGVRYIYETPNNGTQSSVSGVELTPDSLNIMPLEWLEQFHQAAIRGDDAWMNDLLTQIPESHAELAATLTTIIEEFRFDKITAITEQLV
ncbi:ATP-binding protein [Capilliphycus salinus ALCB114379]|uniref:ATP-binding protein n=1 Tax=Capilliphycus salinus TaxID=2768948 RepID=UPI0039A52528